MCASKIYEICILSSILFFKSNCVLSGQYLLS